MDKDFDLAGAWLAGFYCKLSDSGRVDFVSGYDSLSDIFAGCVALCISLSFSIDTRV
jgi:hypothetical protein